MTRKTAGEEAGDDGQGPVVSGDAAYGRGDNLERLEQLGAQPMVTTQPAVACAGRFTKDDFTVDLRHSHSDVPGPGHRGDRCPP